jgi:uncharacterized membrane protein
MSEQPKSGLDSKDFGSRVFWILVVLCAVVFALGFTFEAHGHFEAEHIPGFYALYGFIMFTALILAARLLRVFIKRPEDYYGDKAVDAEPYPEDQLGEAEK